MITVYKYEDTYVNESKSCEVKLKKIVMKIQSVIGIDGYTLMVYLRHDRFYCFSVIDKKGKIYTCDNRFSNLDSATLLAISAIYRTHLVSFQTYIVTGIELMIYQTKDGYLKQQPYWTYAIQTTSGTREKLWLDENELIIPSDPDDTNWV